MALELQLNTAKAQEALKAAARGVNEFDSAVQKLSSAATVVDTVNKALSGIKGISPAAVKSISDLQVAISKLSSNAKLTTVTAGLQDIARVDVGKAAQGVDALGRALSGIKTPRALGQLGNNIAKIGNEARMGAGGVASFGTALAKIGNTNINVRVNSQQLNQGRQAAQQMGAELQKLRQTAQSAAVVIGANLGAQGVGQFVKTSMKASDQVFQFKNRIDAVTNTAGEGAKQFAAFNKVVDELALPLGASTESFGKLSSTIQLTGRSSEEALQIFKGFATGFRVIGLNGEQINRAFNAISQTFNKGSVSSEELKQQLGELFPAFSLLAEAIGVTGDELADMLAKGEVKADQMFKLADLTIDKFGKAIPEALQTGQAAFERLNTSITRAQSKFGDGFYEGVKESINKLARALGSADFLAFSEKAGKAVGQVIGFFADLATAAVENPVIGKGIIATAAIGIGIAVAKIGGAIGGVIGSLSGLAGISGTFGGIGGAAVGLAGILSGTLSGALRGLTTVIGLFLTPLGRIATVAALAVIGITILAAGIAAFFQSFLNGKSIAENFQNNLSGLSEVIGQVAGNMTKAIGDAINPFGESMDTNKPKVTGFTAAVDDAECATEIMAKTTAGASGEFDEFGNRLNLAGKKMSEIGTAVDKSNKSIEETRMAAENGADGLQKLPKPAGEAKDGISQIGTAVEPVPGKLDSLKSSLDSSGDAASTAAGKYDRAANALERLNTAERNSGGGGGSTSAEAFSGGGIAGKGSVRKSVPTSAFIGAPHLAGGIANTNSLTSSLPGGGIPTVLHPNEAVVPLAGGGSIPIAVSGGGMPTSGGGASNTAVSPLSVLLDTFTLMGEIKREVVRVWESVDALMVLTKEQWSNQHLWSQKIVNSIVDLNANLGRSGGGGSSGGGSSGGGGSNSASDFSEFQNELRGLQRGAQDARRNVTAVADSQPYIQYGVPGGGGFRQYTQQGERAIADARLERQRADEDVYNYLRENTAFAKTYFEDAIKKAQSQEQRSNLLLQRKNVLGFATGTPNAFEDTMRGGGFLATLHPDEAVIPLPDGRSVPVKLPDRMMEEIRSAGRGGMQRSAGGQPAQGNTYIINMDVKTADAASFRKGQEQIVAELRGKLERSERASVPAKRQTEDPTRRR